VSCIQVRWPISCRVSSAAWYNTAQSLACCPETSQKRVKVPLGITRSLRFVFYFLARLRLSGRLGSLGPGDRPVCCDELDLPPRLATKGMAASEFYSDGLFYSCWQGWSNQAIPGASGNHIFDTTQSLPLRTLVPCAAFSTAPLVFSEPALPVRLLRNGVLDETRVAGFPVEIDVNQPSYKVRETVRTRSPLLPVLVHLSLLIPRWAAC
jgi:hypothetical protein